MENNDIFSNSGTVADLSAAAHSTETRKPKPKILWIVVAVVAVLGIGIAIYFIFFHKPQTGVDADGVPIVETVYATPTDSENAEEDYLKYLERQKSSARTTTDALSAILSEVNLKIMLEKYDEAQELLDSLSTDTYSSDSELMMIYSAYVQLYSESASNQPALLAEYEAKVEAQRKIITGETINE